jgi:hypothetical protein
MAKCVRCRQRKAKRPCPALGGDLCPLCCGQHRNRDIRCPADCPYLAQHSPYQEQRSQGKEEEDIFQDERLVWLAYNIELPLKALAERYATFSDEEAVWALEYARDKLGRSRNLVILPGEVVRPGSEAGEAVFESMEKSRFERRVILPGYQTGYTQEEKLKVLDRMLLAARSFLKGSSDGRAFLDQLLARHRRAGEMSTRR